VAFTGKRVAIGCLGRSGVTEHSAEDVRQEFGQQSGFLELVGAPGTNELSPVLEFGLPGGGLLGQIEGPHVLAEDFRVEERFGLDSHLPVKRLCGAGEKPSAFLPSRDH
jgi:hypothetical protein